LNFFKYHGCGNDYVYVDCFKTEIKNPSNLAKKISNRRYGIGSDGLILMCPSEVADAKMRIFNSDGSEAKMCGNGIRCVAKYLFDEKKIRKNDLLIETLSGIKCLNILESTLTKSIVMVNMGSPNLQAKKLPFKTEINKEIINDHFEFGSFNFRITCISMGNPHCVIFVEDIENIDIKQQGLAIQNSGYFLEGVNVEFVQVARLQTLNMRVWERGSGETLACGTGACAAAVASVLCGYCKKEHSIDVHLRGGKLKIDFRKKEVFMIGEAVKVFIGIYDENYTNDFKV
jgi:diaminopimelate epimerase